MFQATSFNTDKVNRMGFSKYFLEQSDKMWARGKDMIKYVLKRGGKMGSAFQVGNIEKGIKPPSSHYCLDSSLQ